MSEAQLEEQKLPAGSNAGAVEVAEDDWLDPSAGAKACILGEACESCQ